MIPFKSATEYFALDNQKVSKIIKRPIRITEMLVLCFSNSFFNRSLLFLQQDSFFLICFIFFYIVKIDIVSIFEKIMFIELLLCISSSETID